MKTTTAILVEALVAAALLFAGFGLHSLLGAPGWLLAVFAMPFFVYLRYRLGVGFHFILWFVVLFTTVSIAFTVFLPRAYSSYSGGLVVVLLAPLAGKICRQKP